MDILPRVLMLEINGSQILLGWTYYGELVIGAVEADRDQGQKLIRLEPLGYSL